MKTLLTVVVTLALGMLTGCGQVDMNEPLVSEDLVVPVDGTVLSAEQREAMLSHLPRLSDEMLQAAGTACQPAKTCTGYLSCGSWSPLFNCGSLSACSLSKTQCKQCQYSPDIHKVECDYFGAQTQPKNKYRVCFNASGASCTEFATSASVVCGCAG